MSNNTADQDISWSDKILSFLLYPLPHHWISRVIFFLTRLETPLKGPCIRWFIHHFGVNMSEALHSDPDHFIHFNAFFTRELKPGIRTIANADDALASPVDGTISQIGNINDGRLIQAKNYNYSVLELLGGQHDLTTEFLHGSFTTLYLSPRDYHRIHMPLPGKLRSMIYVPGRLFSVAPHTVRTIPRLFARNERVICIFDSEYGSFAMILVGAINVAAIETIWHGLVTPPQQKYIAEFQYNDKNINLIKGQEMGRFNMGSTVILLTAQNINWLAPLTSGGEVNFGQQLALIQKRPLHQQP